MSAFEQLDPLVQHHIVNTLGWRSLRPFQEACIEPIHSGEHCLLLAPTAGGKTEAASFPVLSRICGENWIGLSVLYICPLRALLNNLHLRLEEYCRMVGRRCELWHGDIGGPQRDRIKEDPPDILLTTPESVEVMLISAKGEGREMLRGVRVVIVDEIHAFAGGDRGWHLLAVLERVTQLAGHEIQRIGLSATVGNPEHLLDWLAGHCAGRRRVIQQAIPLGSAKAEVQLDYVGSLQNAAVVVSRLFRGEKRLVFCDSRSRVEELGSELRQLGVSVFLSHSSLSIEERRSSEQAFAEAQDCVIVATSTLELGIDVGDLDRVIQIDAPWTVASFLQRIGRTGRRSGTIRNCLFLATSENALLRAAALLELWESGFVEPVSPPPRPLHILAQQLMALSLQEKGIGKHDWYKWLSRLPCYSNECKETIDSVVNHLLASQILYSDGTRLSFGDAGQDLYGRRHFLELISVFTSDHVFKIMHGQRELGTVDQITFLRHRREDPLVLSLGGKSWVVSNIEWRKRLAFVTPTDALGKSQWQGGNLAMSWNLSRSVHDLLTETTASNSWTTRTKSAMKSLREKYHFLNKDRDVFVIDKEKNESRWYTFAGFMVNTVIADKLKKNLSKKVTANDFWIRIVDSVDIQKINLIYAETAKEICSKFEIPNDYLENLKFNEAIPSELGREILQKRLVSYCDIESTLSNKFIINEI